MCNHYRKGGPVAEFSQVRLGGGGVKIAELLDLTEHTYPQYLAPVLIQQAGERSLLNKSWGIPICVKIATARHPKGKRFTAHVTNARNDKLTSRPWRQATAERRCLIPATGYFEPGLGPPGAKGEMLFTVRERPLFFFAGLWEGDAFTMVTTEPNEYVQPYHDRMPVVLDDTDLLAWLGDTPLLPAELARLCRGLPSEALHHEVLPPRLKATRPSETKPPPDAQQTLF